MSSSSTPSASGRRSIDAQNFRDFLQLYNSLTEQCFNRCVHSAHSAQLSQQEESCFEKCASKLTNVNHRLMSQFAEQMQFYSQKKLEELQEQQEKLQQQSSVNIPDSN